MSMEIRNPYAMTINMRTTNPIAAGKHLGFFRNRYERGIKRRYKSYLFIPILENKPHLHYHLITSRPTEYKHTEYIDIIKDALSKTKQLQSDYNIVKPAYHIEGWADYITKFKYIDDEVDLINLKR